jgi:hypothetical protein
VTRHSRSAGQPWQARGMVPRDPIPLRPDVNAIRDSAVATLVREAIVHGRNALGERITRAAVNPMATTSASAAAFSQVTAAFLATLVPYSAAADVLERGLNLRFDGSGSISLPAIALGTASFVGEGLAFPVKKFTTSPGVTLHPFKLGTITSLTGEMLRNSNAESIVKQALIDSAAPALDAALFSNAAGVPELRPPGLLNGLTPLTPAAPGAKDEAMRSDLIALASAVSVVAGKSSLAFVMHPAQAVAVNLRSLREFSYIVLPSNALAAGTVIALAVNALVSAVGEAPALDASKEAVVHEEDSTPAAIVTPLGTMASPLRSYFQTDSVGLRLKWPLSWAVRDSRGVAYLTGANW